MPVSTQDTNAFLESSAHAFIESPAHARNSLIAGLSNFLYKLGWTIHFPTSSAGKMRGLDSQIAEPLYPNSYDSQLENPWYPPNPLQPNFSLVVQGGTLVPAGSNTFVSFTPVENPGNANVNFGPSQNDIWWFNFGASATVDFTDLYVPGIYTGSGGEPFSPGTDPANIGLVARFSIVGGGRRVVVLTWTAAASRDTLRPVTFDSVALLGGAFPFTVSIEADNMSTAFMDSNPSIDRQNPGYNGAMRVLFGATKVG